MALRIQLRAYKIIQKYSAASDTIVNGVLNNLAEQITKVASVTKGTYDNQVLESKHEEKIKDNGYSQNCSLVRKAE